MRSSFALGALVALFAVTAWADDAPRPPRVVVVGVDQKTLDALGPWGGRYRANHAKLIEQLDKAGVKGVAFDVYLPENPDFADATAAIAKAAKASKAPVVIASNPEDGGPNAKVLTDAGVAEGNVKATSALDVKNDADGMSVTVVDKALPATLDGKRSLSAELAVRSGLLSADDVDALAEDVTVGVEDGKPVTLHAFKAASGDPKDVTTVSYVDVLEGKVDPKVLEGAVVLVGMTDGKMDVIPHPKTGEDTPGVYFHAFTLNRFVEAAASKAAPVAAPSRTKGLVGSVER